MANLSLAGLSYYSCQRRFNWWVILAIVGWLLFLLVLYLWIGLPDLEAQPEPDWNDLVSKIIILESSGNPNAISKAGCIGLMGISPIVLEEYNDNVPCPRVLYRKQIHSVNLNDLNSLYEIGDLFEETINIAIGTWYLKHIRFHYLPYYHIIPCAEDERYNLNCWKEIDLILIAWNWGIGNLNKWYKSGAKWNKLPIETRKYIKRYHQLEKNIK